MGQQPSTVATGQPPGLSNGTSSSSPTSASNSPAFSRGAAPTPEAAGHVANVALDVSGIDLSGDRLALFLKSGQLKTDPSYRAVATLSLSNCQLNRVDWLASLDQAATLTDLDLSRNLLTSLEEQNELVFFLKQLQRLNLSYNYLVVMPPLFFNFVHLQILNVSNNNIDTLCPELQYLEQLTDLDLSCNQLRAVPDQLGKIPNLQKLKLNQNKLAILPDSIGGLGKLIQLSLSDNFLKRLPDSVAKLTALRKLYLDNNELEEITNETCAGLRSLREIFLNQNRLSTLPVSIGNLENLSLIDFADNSFALDSPLAIAAAKSDTDATKMSELLLAQQLFAKNQNPSSRRQQREQKRGAKAGRDTLRRLAAASAATPTAASLFANAPAASNTPTVPKKKKENVPAKLYRFTAIQNTDYVVVDRLPVALDSFNLVFGAYVLEVPIPGDAAAVLLIWHGERCDPREAAKAGHVARSIANEVYADYASVVTLDQKMRSSWSAAFPASAIGAPVPSVSPLALFAQQFRLATEKDWKQTEKALKTKYKDKEQYANDVIAHRVEFSRLWKFQLLDDLESGSSAVAQNEDSGNVSITIVGGDGLPMSKTALESGAVYVADCAGQHGSCPAVWVWCGHFADSNSRNWALLKAEQLMNAAAGASEDSSAADAELLWNIDGAEMWDFKELFWDWDSYEWDPKHRELLQQQMIEEQNQRKELEAEMQQMAAANFQREAAKAAEQQYIQQMSAPEKPAAAELSPRPTTPEPQVEPEPDPSAGDDISNKPSSMRRGGRKKTGSSAALPVQPPSTAGPDPQLAAAKPVTPRATEPIPAQPSVKVEPVKPVAPADPLVALAALIGVPKPTPPMPVDFAKKAGYFEQAERVQSRSLATATASASSASAGAGSSASADRRPLSRVLSAFNIGGPTAPRPEDQVPASSTDAPRLAGPRRVAAPAGRRAATTNPVRQRQALENQSAEGASQETSAAAAAQREANLRAAGGGMMGFGKGILGAAESKLKLQRDKAEGLVEGNAAATGSSEDAYAKKGQPRLMHIKGRRKLIVRLVELTYLSLNDGDVFVLDNGKGVLYQWNGKNANRIEKGKGMDLCKNIKDKELMGNGRVVVLEQGGNDSTEQAAQFWSILGGSASSELAPADAAGDDNTVDEELKEFTNLFKIVSSEALPSSNSSGALAAPGSRRRALSRQVSVAVDIQPELVARYPLKKDMLTGEDCYILDCSSELYVWCGGKSPTAIRKQTMKLVEDLRFSRVNQDGLWVAPIARELPGGETVLFREKFSDWGYGPPIQMQQIAVGKNVAKVAQGDAVDVIALFNKRTERQEVLIDDGKGKKKIWRIVDFKKVAVDPTEYGQFYAGDSYIILYTYPVRNKEAHMIFFWQGTSSSINEKGTSALLTIELGDEIDKGNTKEVRVVMNQEPRHFLLVFKDSYVVHMGKADGGGASETTKSSAVYQIHGASEHYCKCVQVDAVPNAFESTSRYIVVGAAEDGRKLYTWAGKHSLPYEENYSNAVEKVISKVYSCAATAKSVAEGSESSDFWKALGISRSKAPKPFPVVPIERKYPVRLFHSSEATGQHKVWEIPPPFSQEDLARNECFILDTFHRVFVWHFKASPSDLKKARLWSG